MTGPTPRTAYQRGLSVEERLDLLESRGSNLPGRISEFGQEVDSWDEATRDGFYWSADGYVGQVLRSPSGIVQERQKIVPAQSRSEWRSLNGTAWSPWRREDGLFRGTATERGDTTPAYWDFWQDTDGAQKLFVGSKSGTWRQFSGAVGQAARAWDVSAAPIYGRTDTSQLPTVLETTETFQLTLTDGGTAYAAFAMAGLIRNPTTTDVVTRLTAFANPSTQAYAFAWSIQQI